MIYVGNEHHYGGLSLEGGAPCVVNDRFTGAGLVDDLPEPWRVEQAPAHWEEQQRAHLLRAAASVGCLLFEVKTPTEHGEPVQLVLGRTDLLDLRTLLDHAWVAGRKVD